MSATKTALIVAFLVIFAIGMLCCHPFACRGESLGGMVYEMNGTVKGFGYAHGDGRFAVVREGSFPSQSEQVYLKTVVNLSCACQDAMREIPGLGMMCMFCTRGRKMEIYDHSSADTDDHSGTHRGRWYRPSLG